MSKLKHWSTDPYWTEAQDKFLRLRDQERKTQFEIDLAAIEQIAFEADGPAYKMMEAMVSVYQHEKGDGFRGAPRLLLALLVQLEALSSERKLKARDL